MDALELEILTVPLVNYQQNRHRGLPTNAWHSAQITQLIFFHLQVVSASNVTVSVQLAVDKMITTV